LRGHFRVDHLFQSSNKMRGDGNGGIRSEKTRGIKKRSHFKRREQVRNPGSRGEVDRGTGRGNLNGRGGRKLG